MTKTVDNTMLISVPTGLKVIRAEVNKDGRTIRVIFGDKDEIAGSELNNNGLDDFDIRFPIVPASKLSLQDKFMKYKPKTDAQKRQMTRLTKAIKRGLKDFRVSAMDPSFNPNGEIVYEAGKKPAVGKSPKWWKKELMGVMPEKVSKMGPKTKYVAFAGYIIKYLVSIGWKIEKAWEAVCDDSRELGHYWNSKNAKHAFELTGSRLIGVFYDLANTCKILENDDLDGDDASGFVLASGYYSGGSGYCPLADIGGIFNPYDNYYYSVGWLVLEEV